MDIERAKEIVSTLAQGIDPVTGEILPADHVCNQAEVIRALYCVLDKVNKTPSKSPAENAGKPWTEGDDSKLCQMFEHGATKREMCKYFKRSHGSITARLIRLGKVTSPQEDLTTNAGAK